MWKPGIVGGDWECKIIFLLLGHQLFYSEDAGRSFLQLTDTFLSDCNIKMAIFILTAKRT